MIEKEKLLSLLKKQLKDKKIVTNDNKLNKVITELRIIIEKEEERLPEAEPTEDGVQTSDLASFLSEVGNSVIESQRQMDIQSKNYLDSIQNKAFLPPTIFRIPKITAELKLGLSRSIESKLTALIFSKKSKAEEINQQSIKMEIMAVPASVEAIQQLKKDVPSVNMILNITERDRLFSFIKNTRLPRATQDQRDRFLKHKNRTVFCETFEPKQFIIFFAQTDDAKEVEVWELNLKEKTLNLRQNLKSAKVFRDFINKIIDKQEMLFKNG